MQTRTDSVATEAERTPAATVNTPIPALPVDKPSKTADILSLLNRSGWPAADKPRRSRVEEFRSLRAQAIARRREIPCHFESGIEKLLMIAVDRHALEADLRGQGPRIGKETAGSHVGEVLQGVDILPGLPAHLQDSRLGEIDAVRFLMDLPADGIHSTATVTVTEGTGAIITGPAGLTKAAYAVEALLTFLGFETTLDVRIMLETNIRQGRGLGSSSADVRAVLKALAGALHVTLDDEVIDKLTVIAEGATNPASRAPSLFCHRLGITMARLPAWPTITVLPFDDIAAPNVDTDVYRPAQYDADERRRFGLLSRAAVAAIVDSNPHALGIVASTSAEINDGFLPRRHGSSLASLRRIVRATEAVGFAVSHSGTVGALLYATPSADLPRRLNQAAAHLIGASCAIICPPFQL